MTNSQNFLFIENKGGIIIFYNLFYTMVYNTPPHPPKKGFNYPKCHFNFSFPT